jgi:hypothetical protein
VVALSVDAEKACAAEPVIAALVSRAVCTFPLTVSSAACKPSTLAMTWLWLSSATVAVIVTSADPLNDTLPDTSPPRVMVRAVCSVVDVDALPVRAASTVAATNVSLPIVHLSADSSHTSVLLVDVPRSTSIPEFWLGVPASLLLRRIMLSARLIVSVLTVVVVPDTVRLPLILALPVAVISAKVTLDVVATA